MRAYVATAHRLIAFLGQHRGEEIDAAALARPTPRTCAPSSPTAAPRARRVVGSARTFGGSRLPQICGGAAGEARAAAAHACAQAAAHAAAAGRAGGSNGARGKCRGGGERAVDWRARPRDPAAALRRRPACRRGDVADRAVLPIGSTLRVTGKRSKTRVVPIVPAVREAIDEYVRQCPYPRSGEAPLFVGARGGPLNPDLVRRSVAAARRRLGLAGEPHPACAPAQFRDPSACAGGGLARASGAARSRQPVLDANLYGGGRGATFGRLSPRPPPRLSRGPEDRETMRPGNAIMPRPRRLVGQSPRGTKNRAKQQR